MFPAADSLEKEGSASNSGRWLQWRYQAVKPHGDAKSDLWYANRLGLELQKLYKADPKAPSPEPIVKLELELRRGPGRAPGGQRDQRLHRGGQKAGGQLPGASKTTAPRPAAAGSTPGSYPGPDKKDNLMARRDAKDVSGLMLYPTWAWAWPVNRRIIYNRCSLDPQGVPWSKDKAMFAWDEAAKTWKNLDVPDFKWIDPATKVHVPPEESAKAPFIMLPEGKSRLFVPGGLCKEGPFPEHYEALECPLRQPGLQAAVQPGHEGLGIGRGPGGGGVRPQVSPSSPPPSG